MNSETQTQTPSKFRRNLVIALGVLWITLPPLMGFWLLGELGTVGDWLKSHPDYGLALFITMFALTSGFGLLPTYAQAILGGWVFGVTIGTAAAMCGLLCGVMIGFTFSRIVSGASIKALIDSNPRGRVIRNALVESSQRRTFLLILLLRLPPNSPFAIANLAMGASGVRALPLLGGTALGMFPRTLITCGAAAAAAQTGARDFQQLFSETGWGFIAVGICSFIIALLIIRVVSIRALKSAGLMSESPP